MSPSLPLQSRTTPGNNGEESEKKPPAFPSKKEVADCIKVLSYVEYRLSHGKNRDTIHSNLEEVLLKVASIQHHAKELVRPAEVIAEETEKEKASATKRKAQMEVVNRLEKKRAEMVSECRKLLPRGYTEKVRREVLQEMGLPLDTLTMGDVNYNPAKKSAKRKAQTQARREEKLRKAGPVVLAIAEARRRCQELKKDGRIPNGSTERIKLQVLEEFGLPPDTPFPTNYQIKTRGAHVKVTKALSLDSHETSNNNGVDEGGVARTSNSTGNNAGSNAGHSK